MLDPFREWLVAHGIDPATGDPVAEPSDYGAQEPGAPEYEPPTLLGPMPLTAGDRIALALASTPQFEGGRPYESGMSGFVRGLASGAAGGYSRARVAGMQRREGERAAENQRRTATAERNYQAATRSYEGRQSEARAKRIKAAPGPPTVKETPEDEATRLKRIEAEAEARARGGRRGAPPTANEDDPLVTDMLVEAVQTGNQEPPSGAMLYRTKGGRQFLAAMQRHGVNPAKLRTNWNAAQQYYKTQNTRPFIMLRTQIDNAVAMIDKYEELSEELNQLVPDYKVTGVNRIMRNLEKQGMANNDAGRIIQQMQSIAPGLKTEIANVYMGGGTPTDHAMRLAENFVDPNLNYNLRRAQIEVNRFEIGVRKHALSTAGMQTTEGIVPVRGITGATSPQVQPTARVKVVGPNGESGTVEQWDTLPPGWKVVK